MFYTLPSGHVINKHQIVKMDENADGNTRIVMTGNITVVVRGYSLQDVLKLLGE